MYLRVHVHVNTVTPQTHTASVCVCVRMCGVFVGPHVCVHPLGYICMCVIDPV